MPDVEGRFGRDVDEAPEFLRSFGVTVAPGGGFRAFVGDDIEEFFVLIFCDFFFRTTPESGFFVEAFRFFDF